MTFLRWIAAVAVFALATPALATNPYIQPDGTWISLSGTVLDAKGSAFTLDYGEGVVAVEMDDWSVDADGAVLVDGDKVTVYGKVDDDFAEFTTIEASSVYIESLGRYFYANAADEESLRFSIVTPIVIGDVELVGTVSSVGTNEFTVNYGAKDITVDTSELVNNPLDNKGVRKISEGDLVSVDGSAREGLFDNLKLVADHVIILDRDNA